MVKGSLRTGCPVKVEIFVAELAAKSRAVWVALPSAVAPRYQPNAEAKPKLNTEPGLMCRPGPTPPRTRAGSTVRCSGTKTPSSTSVLLAVPRREQVSHSSAMEYSARGTMAQRMRGGCSGPLGGAIRPTMAQLQCGDPLEYGQRPLTW